MIPRMKFTYPIHQYQTTPSSNQLTTGFPAERPFSSPTPPRSGTVLLKVSFTNPVALARRAVDVAVALRDSIRDEREVIVSGMSRSRSAMFAEGVDLVGGSREML